jgi:hypothetical protein
VRRALSAHTNLKECASPARLAFSFVLATQQPIHAGPFSMDKGRSHAKQTSGYAPPLVRAEPVEALSFCFDF